MSSEANPRRKRTRRSLYRPASSLLEEIIYKYCDENEVSIVAYCQSIGMNYKTYRTIVAGDSQDLAIESAYQLWTSLGLTPSQLYAHLVAIPMRQPAVKPWQTFMRSYELMWCSGMLPAEIDRVLGCYPDYCLFMNTPDRVAAMQSMIVDSIKDGILSSVASDNDEKRGA